MLEGKYPSEKREESKAVVPANREVSSRIAVQTDDSDDVFKHDVMDPLAVQQTDDSDDVFKHDVMDPLAVQQTDDCDEVFKHNVMDPLAVQNDTDLPPSSQFKIIKPIVPNPYEKNSWLAIEIEKLLNMKSRMANSKFKFEVNPEAASSNFNKLAKNDFKLGELLNPEKRCMTSYGSELKEVNELEGLLSKHPWWNDLKEKITKGCEYYLEDLPEEQRLQDLKERIERGSHKSAVKHDKFLSDAMKKEIEKGWALIIPEEEALKIPLIEIAPLGVAEHLGISEEGMYVPKFRLTHDLSFPGVISEE